jgi:LruC domain-containing protein
MYYKTTENMPWALHFFNAFDYPREKAEITDAHLKFYEWASSDGNVFQDWYLDIPNYRNEDYIYHP